jgi:hypothetical protein
MTRIHVKKISSEEWRKLQQQQGCFMEIMDKGDTERKNTVQYYKILTEGQDAGY